MYNRVFLPIVELLGYDLLPIAVCEEVYGASGNDAGQGWDETLE